MSLIGPKALLTSMPCTCSMHRKCPYSAGDTDVFCHNKCGIPLLWDMKIEYHFKINVLIPEIKISV